MKQENKIQYAVVTGASQGLGKAFALELARLHKNLILVSLPGQNLHQLAKEIQEEYCIEVKYYETDFTSTENILKLCDWLNNNFNINILINNAGIGGTCKFDEVNHDYINNIIQINIKATSLLTHQLLPNMKKREQSYILNVSSMAAFTPIGYKTVYSASKAFINSFSRGLHAELKGSNVFVAVINPGAMATNDEVSGRIKKQGRLIKFTLVDPQFVARHSLKRLLKKCSHIILNPGLWTIAVIFPTWILQYFMTKIIKREIHEAI